MTKVEELEKTILDQIEKLNDDSLFEEESKAKIVVERSKAISGLTQNFVEMQRMKLDVVRTMADTRGIYGEYLGVESKKIR